MEEFQSKMVKVSNGSATMLEPVDLGERLKESELESLLLQNPELAGEPLLVLGSQLAEFAEDKTDSTCWRSTGVERSFSSNLRSTALSASPICRRSPMPPVTPPYRPTILPKFCGNA
jgi:hypothetical protein